MTDDELEKIRLAIEDKSFFSLTGYGDSAERIVRFKDILDVLENIRQNQYLRGK